MTDNMDMDDQKAQPVLSRPIILACIAILLLLHTTRRIYRWHRLRHIPGPRYAGWSVWWQLRHGMAGRYHEVVKENIDLHGPLIRVGPNELITVDPDVVRRMASSRRPFRKGPFYQTGQITPGVDNVVSAMDPETHIAMRARMAPGFSGKEIGGCSFEPGIDRQIMSFVRLLERKYLSTDSSTRPFDLAQKTQFLALDAIADVSFGSPFGFIEHDEDVFRYNEINDSGLLAMQLVSLLPWLGKLIHQWPFRLVLPREKDKVGFGRLMRLASESVDERLQDDKNRHKDMIQVHIDNGMSRSELIQQVFINVIAGSNSSAQVLRMMLLSLMTTPTAYHTLVAEITEATSIVSTPISWTESRQLPYLQAVVREALRLWPPIAGPGYKVVPPEGVVICGFNVPGGTQIGQSFAGIGRSKALWGEDAEVFRPERWLDADPERLKTMVGDLDTHFGAGCYGCMGKQIAWMELHKTIFELLRRFDFALLDPSKPLKSFSAVFLSTQDIWVTIRERDMASGSRMPKL